MANHARVWHCKKQFDTKKIKQTLEVFNKEHLFGLFKVWHDDDNFSIYFNDNNNPLIDENSFVIGQGFWIDRDENHLEFRHGHHGRTFDWWLDTALEYYLANVFDGQINDEGVGLVAFGFPTCEYLQQFLIVDGAKIPYVYGMACPRCGEKTEMYYTPYCPKCDIQKMLKHQHGSYNLIPILHYGESYVKGFDLDLIWDYFGDRGLRNDSYIDWAYDTKDLADKWTSITTRE